MNTWDYVYEERNRVKNEVRKYLQENPAIYDLTGCRGRRIQVFLDRCVIYTDVTIGSVLTNNATDGEKTIFYSDVLGVQFKLSGLTIGYIQLETAGIQGNNPQSNFFNENTYTFNDNTQMTEVYEYIVYQVSVRKAIDTVTSKEPTVIYQYDISDEKKTYLIKELSLTKTEDQYLCTLKIENVKSFFKVKALMVSLVFINAFGQSNVLEHVHFMFEKYKVSDKSVVSEDSFYEIPNEYLRSIKTVELAVEQVVYAEEIPEVMNEEMLEDVPNQGEDIVGDRKTDSEFYKAVIQRGNNLQRATEIHDFLLYEGEKAGIVFTENIQDKLQNAVKIERMFGNNKKQYLQILEEYVELL